VCFLHGEGGLSFYLTSFTWAKIGQPKGKNAKNRLVMAVPPLGFLALYCTPVFAVCQYILPK